MEALIYIILIIVLILIFIILGKYNHLVRLQNRVKKSQANIEVYLNKRFDLIPNIVECVKGYSKHEKSTLEDITALRSNYNKKSNMDLKEAGKMNDELTKLLAVVEAYPDLKANSEYLSLQHKLAEIEDELQRARHVYNDEVTRYNTLIETVPSNIVAAMFAFRKADWFKAEEDKKENVKVKI